MKLVFLTFFLSFFHVLSFCQNNIDTLTEVHTHKGYTTIRHGQKISGTVIDFCNGLSLDFGETYGLIVLTDSATRKNYNILLSPHKFYKIKKGQSLVLTIEPYIGDFESLSICKKKLNGEIIVTQKNSK